MSVTGGVGTVAGGVAGGPALIDVGAANSDGTLRRWLGQQAVEMGEAILGAQLASVTRLTTSATSMLGWSVTISLALIAAISSALSPPGTTGTAASGVAVFLGNLLWPGIVALGSTLIAAVCCVIVLWPGYWHPPGHAPDLVLNAPYDTELEVLEALAGGYADAVHANSRRLTRLELWLRAAWLFFAGAPVIGAAVYAGRTFEVIDRILRALT
jgi:hypothetical protein